VKETRTIPGYLQASPSALCLIFSASVTSSGYTDILVARRRPRRYASSILPLLLAEAE